MYFSVDSIKGEHSFSSIIHSTLKSQDEPSWFKTHNRCHMEEWAGL